MLIKIIFLISFSMFSTFNISLACINYLWLILWSLITFFFDKSVAKYCKIPTVKKIWPCPKNQNIPNQVSNNKMDNFLAFLYVLVITENYQIKKILLLKLFFYFWDKVIPWKNTFLRRFLSSCFQEKNLCTKLFTKFLHCKCHYNVAWRCGREIFFKIFHFFHSQNFPYETWILP